MNIQNDLFGTAARREAIFPTGFHYWSDLLSPAAQDLLVRHMAELPFKPFEFHGYHGNRRTISFGLRYDYASRKVEASAPMPDFLIELRKQMAALVGLPGDDFAQALINEYAAGAGIGWHRDKPQFGLVMGLSLLTPCVLRFRRTDGEKWERAAAPLEPGSAYLLSGPTRSEWQHSILPMDALRYSVTFRTLARAD